MAAGGRVAAQQVLCRLENVVSECQAAEAIAESEAARLQYSRSWTGGPQTTAAAQFVGPS